MLLTPSLYRFGVGGLANLCLDTTSRDKILGQAELIEPLLLSTDTECVISSLTLYFYLR